MIDELYGGINFVKAYGTFLLIFQKNLKLSPTPCVFSKVCVKDLLLSVSSPLFGSQLPGVTFSSSL